MPESLNYVQLAMKLLHLAVELVRRIKEQEGLTTEELWARSDAQVQANRKDIETFLAGLKE